MSPKDIILIEKKKKMREKKRKIPTLNKVKENYEDFLRFILSFCNFKLYYLNKNIKKYFNYFYVFKWFPVRIPYLVSILTLQI